MEKYEFEKKVCEYLGFRVTKKDWVLVLGKVKSTKSNVEHGWIRKCHISNLKKYLTDHCEYELPIRVQRKHKLKKLYYKKPDF